ncbi:MAG TPA: hypothetical protein VLN58_07100, partial [Verrucomicrobiae bacterium]|nr:hypothetical protein [Verrucomicrobiae bacterium]
MQPLYQPLCGRLYLPGLIPRVQSEWAQGTERYLLLREVFKFMLAKFTRSSAEPEDPAIAIHRLLGLL